MLSYIIRCPRDGFLGSDVDIKTGKSCELNEMTGLYTETCRFKAASAQTSASLLNYEYFDTVISHSYPTATC